MTSWEAGATVAGRYRLESELGSGAAGQVWRAFDEKLRAPVALKGLDPAFADTPIAQRFLREAQAAARIRSLHVVQILDTGVDEAHRAYIAMELLEGETLSARLDRVSRLSSYDVCRFLGHVAKAVDKAHAMSIVHRDLKPENVFLVREDDDEIAKVFDFGIAKLSAPGELSMTALGALLGTPTHMSPEQARGDAVDHRSDLYALAILAFECKTGGLPFSTYEPRAVLAKAAQGQLLRPTEVAPDVPSDFDAWFARAAARDPSDRFASAKELVEALRVALGVEA